MIDTEEDPSMSNNEELVSVILPTCNRANVLPRALDSVLSQSGADFEVICIDDASSDATSQLLQAFQHKRLHCVRHSSRQGAAAARNTGIRASRGTWLAFLDSDDEWLPGYLSTQRERFRGCEPQVGVVFTSFERIRGRQRQLIPGRQRKLLSHLPYERYQLDGNLTLALQRGNFITLQSAVIRRSCFDRVGLFDEYLPRLQDWDLWLRLAPLYKFSWIPQPFVRIHDTPGSISNTAKLLPEALRIIREKYTPAPPELLAHIDFVLGDWHMANGQKRQGVTHFRQAVHNSPWTLLYWFSSLSAALSPSLYRFLSSRIGFAYTPEKI